MGYGVSCDNIDVGAVGHHGVRMTNVQSYVNQAVSDHALALLFSCSHLLALGQHSFRDNFGKPLANDEDVKDELNEKK